MHEFALSGDGHALTEGWEACLTPPGAAADLGALAGERFFPAQVPGTIASALRAARAWSLEAPRDFDAEDVFYRCRFARPHAPPGSKFRLCFDCLATLADVFLNGEPLLSADNQFVRHAADVTAALRDDNELIIRFRALAPELKQKKLRPRFRTKLVAEQQLRFIRTTLLGRIPSWSPPVAPVGPLRAIRLEVEGRAFIAARALRTRIDDGAGVVEARLELSLVGQARVKSARLVVGDRELSLSVDTRFGTAVLSGKLRRENAPLWWPHTHGAQPLFTTALVVDFDDGATVRRELGHVGFRDLSLDTSDGGFSLSVNGTSVFCRGACWTPLDIVTLATNPDECRRALRLARDAGMNMIRVGGTMIYEADVFYDLCDELGLLVWQDFMFANMDYPATDDTFIANVRREALEILGRLQHRPSTAAFCGNSEVEQQAAMLGLPRDVWSNELFARILPELVRDSCPAVPYLPSTPSGGALPFQVNAGVSHYYGVGAYERPFDDARRSRVRFTAECLAFANVPEASTLDRLAPDGIPPVHDPRWKARVPRDRGPGWDFDDVRDHYMALLFGEASRGVRYGDPERYLELARVTTGEAMERVFSEWRRPASVTRGALVWFYRDLWPGAGWGVVDSMGRPKAAYFYLRRVLASRVIVLSDEGLDGLFAHIVNERDAPFDAEVRMSLYRHGETLVTEGTSRRTIPSRSGSSFGPSDFFETFVDTTYAYRFGPPGHDLVAATLSDTATGERLGTAFYCPLGFAKEQEPDVGLDAFAEPAGATSFFVEVSTKRFAQSVSLDVRGGVPEDDYFHLAPGDRHRVRVEVTSPSAKLQGSAKALNAHRVVKIRQGAGHGGSHSS